LSEGKWIILAKETACRGGVFPLFSQKIGMAHFLPSFSLRSFSEGGRVQILPKHYACRACPAFANQKRGYKFDRSSEFITDYKVCGGHWRSVAVQSWSKPENCQGI